MMPQPWCRDMDKTAGGEVSFFAEFECQTCPECAVYLVLERPDLYQVTLNGKSVLLKDSGEWHSSAWRKIELAADLFVPGKNKIEFKTRLSYAHPGLESMFFVGDFGVKTDGNGFILTRPVRELALGDWTAQGLPFYPGEVVYKTKVTSSAMDHAAIRIPDYCGTPVKVEINKTFADRILFSPATTKVMELPAEFELKITITGSMRNTCGPFFHGEEKLSFFGPQCYKEQTQKTRRIASYGLYAAPELLGES